MRTTGTTWGGDNGDHCHRGVGTTWGPCGGFGDDVGMMGMTRMTWGPQGPHGDNEITNKEAIQLYAELFFGHLGPSKVSEYIMILVALIVPKTISN